MNTRDPGWDQKEIKRITDEYFFDDRKRLADFVQADTTKYNWQLSLSQDICRVFGSIEKFSSHHPPLGNQIWPSNRSAYITSFWGWKPDTWGCIGFAAEGRRNTYLSKTTDPFIMVIFATETAPTNQKDLQGKIVGFYEVSHEIGSREDFTDTLHHSHDIGRWPYSLRAVKAFSFVKEYQLSIRELIPDYSQSNARTIATHGKELSDEQIAKLRELPLVEVPVFKGNPHVSNQIQFATPRKGRTQAGTVNRSGYYIPGEPSDTPKELYILKLEGDSSAFLGRPNEGKSIFKIGLSMSPSNRMKTFQKAIPKGAYNWQIVRTTRRDNGEAYPNYNIALAGEEAMKDYLKMHADWLDGEFYAASDEVITKAWQIGKATAEKV